MRSWPFVTIIAIDMLLLLALGYLAFADLNVKLDAVNKKIEVAAVKQAMLEDRIAQVENSQKFDQMTPPRSPSGAGTNTNKPAPRH